MAILILPNPLPRRGVLMPTQQPNTRALLCLALFGGVVLGCVLLVGCGQAPQSAQSATNVMENSVNNNADTLRTTLAKSAQPEVVTLQNLSDIANLPVIDSVQPDTLTMVTSISNAVAIPVHVSVGDAPDSQTVTVIAPMGHRAETIAATNAMLDAMSQGMQTDNADVAFVQSMLAHQNAALQLAQIELKYGRDEQLRKLAEDSLFTRSNEIRWLQNWLAHNVNTGKPTTMPATLAKEPSYTESLKQMYQQMLSASAIDDPDEAFRQAMIPHHKGAMAMAQIELKYGKDDKIRQFADRTIETQQAEINTLRNWTPIADQTARVSSDIASTSFASNDAPLWTQTHAGF